MSGCVLPVPGARWSGLGLPVSRSPVFVSRCRGGWWLPVWKVHLAAEFGPPTHAMRVKLCLLCPSSHHKLTLSAPVSIPLLGLGLCLCMCGIILYPCSPHCVPFLRTSALLPKRNRTKRVSEGGMVERQMQREQALRQGSGWANTWIPPVQHLATSLVLMYHLY